MTDNSGDLIFFLKILKFELIMNKWVTWLRCNQTRRTTIGKVLVWQVVSQVEKLFHNLLCLHLKLGSGVYSWWNHNSVGKNLVQKSWTSPPMYSMLSSPQNSMLYFCHHSIVDAIRIVGLRRYWAIMSV